MRHLYENTGLHTQGRPDGQHFNADLYNIIIVILSAILMIVVWRMSHQPSRYVFAAIQALTIVLMASYTFDLTSPTLQEKLFWNNFEYMGLVFIPALVLVIAFQLSGNTAWVTNRRILPLLDIVLFLYCPGTNNYHHLFYENVTLASDPCIRSPPSEDRCSMCSLRWP